MRRPKTFRPAGRPDPTSAARRYDRDRRQALPTRRLYGLAQWQQIRDDQLQAEPLCRECIKADRITAATVCDHVHPHHGDVDKFWAGPFQSLCEPCHNGVKQREERGSSARG